MPMRSLEELQRDQSALLAAHRARLQAASGGETSLSPSTGFQWGKILEIVADDPDHGPHLIIQAYIPIRRPPVFTAAPAAPVRCFPSPGRTVTDYAVDDFVHLMPTCAGIIALRLA